MKMSLVGELLLAVLVLFVFCAGHAQGANCTFLALHKTPLVVQHDQDQKASGSLLESFSHSSELKDMGN
jgi:hypothetical protein